VIFGVKSIEEFTFMPTKRQLSKLRIYFFTDTLALTKEEPTGRYVFKYVTSLVGDLTPLASA
jgi:hypothetical protein